MKINIISGEITDISATKEALVQTHFVDPLKDDWALAAQERSGYWAAEIVAARVIIDADGRGGVSRFLVDLGASKHMCKDVYVCQSFAHVGAWGHVAHLTVLWF